MQVTRVDFIALPVEDLARADAFYGETLGLARNPNGSGERWVEYETGNLTLALSTFGGSIALGVPGVKEARSELERQDVQFAMETFDTGVCYGAPFADPDGNRLQLHHRYEPLERFEVPEGEVSVDFVSIPTRDVARAVSWYRDVLGLAESDYSEGEVESSNVTFSFWRPEDDNLPFAPNNGGVALRVPDVESAVEEARAGGAIVIGIEDTGVCHMGFVRDPDGNVIILHRRYAPRVKR
jgi:catechol 2,3-dioxygenase-like lactoylglutathione lyase family enzyme